MSKNRLIIFTRLPVPGKAKTRLIPQLGEIKAAQTHRELAEFTFRLAESFKTVFDIKITVSTHGGTKEQFRQWLGDQYSYVEQSPGNLGNKISRALQVAFNNEASKVVIIGTDCPELTVEILNKAFAELTTNNLVIGPATDGGYYLIGLSSFYPELFHNIPWGKEDVFNTTIEIADKLKISRGTLPALNDIDRPEDLHIWNRIKNIHENFSNHSCR